MEPGPADRMTSHSLPPCAHEAMRLLVPGLDRLIGETVRHLRASGRDECETIPNPALLELDLVQEYLKVHARGIYDRCGSAEEATNDANWLGHHVWYLLNFEVHRRKLFWADASLAWMLGQTRLDIEGRCLKLPFPSFGIVLTDRTTLALADALLSRDASLITRGDGAKIVTVYVTRVPAEGEAVGINLSFLFDSRTGTWPYLVSRDLHVQPEDHLERILDSHFPEVAPQRLDPFFNAPELKQLVQLVINCILYATSAHLDWAILESPIKQLARSARDRGKKKQQRVAHRILDLKKEHSSENVFYLPGKIPISQIRRLREIERSSGGSALMARFMVRGHWRRANPSWTDQAVRWVEPYWKGPDMGTIIEREYRMKP